VLPPHHLLPAVEERSLYFTVIIHSRGRSFIVIINHQDINMDIKFVRQHIPGLWLLTNRPWAEMQVKASGAAVLTPSVNPSRWFQGFANAKPICMSKVRVVDASTPTKPLDALSAESLADDLFRRIAALDLIAFSPFFHEDLLCQSPWSAEDLARLLNHNLLTIRQPVTMESLHTPRDVSLEMLYGLVLSRWTEACDIIMHYCSLCSTAHCDIDTPARGGRCPVSSESRPSGHSHPPEK
jgi:hypothetical protein